MGDGGGGAVVSRSRAGLPMYICMKLVRSTYLPTYLSTYTQAVGWAGWDKRERGRQSNNMYIHTYVGR